MIPSRWYSMELEAARVWANDHQGGWGAQSGFPIRCITGKLPSQEPLRTAHHCSKIPALTNINHATSHQSGWNIMSYPLLTSMNHDLITVIHHKYRPQPTRVNLSCVIADSSWWSCLCQCFELHVVSVRADAWRWFMPRFPQKFLVIGDDANCSVTNWTTITCLARTHQRQQKRWGEKAESTYETTK